MKYKTKKNIKKTVRQGAGQRIFKMGKNPVKPFAISTRAQP